MRIIHQAGEFVSDKAKVCLAIGVFDGVHLGHQQVLRQTIADALQHEASSVIVTFDRHPGSVIAPAKAPALIYTLLQKLKVLSEFNPDAILVIHFDREFSEQPAETFIRKLVRELGQLQSICVGSSFAFGRNRSGNVALLKTLGKELGFAVHGLAAVSLDNRVVSSTRIRESIRNGSLDEAGQMLGRSYGLSSEIIHGDHLGRTLGFRTANLDVTGLVTPPPGVYAVHAVLNGKSHRAVVNIGFRPTLEQKAPSLRVEAHLLDFSQEIYGQQIELAFVGRIREELKFSSPQALKEQIARDILMARTLFV